MGKSEKGILRPLFWWCRDNLIFNNLFMLVKQIKVPKRMIKINTATERKILAGMKVEEKDKINK